MELRAVEVQGSIFVGGLTHRVLCLQGLSTELGAFVAGVMLSTTEQQEHALSQLDHVRNFFLSLFIASIGLVMSPSFLMQHLKVLAGDATPFPALQKTQRYSFLKPSFLIMTGNSVQENFDKRDKKKHR
jgi:hypothetical protein